MLAHLESLGVPEAVAREHSLGWISQTADELARRRRADLANQMTVWFVAAAAANGSREAADEMERLLGELNPPTEEDVSHLLDPNAQTDLAAVAASQKRPALGVERVKVTPEEPHA